MPADLTKSISIEQDSDSRKIYIVPCSNGCGRFARVRSDYAKIATGKCRHCAQIVRGLIETSFYELQKASIRRGIPISLTLSEFRELTQKCSCTYCGTHLEWTGRNYNLDRKDPDLGYTSDNVVVCCKECNRVKGCIYSYEQMMKLGLVLRTFPSIRSKQSLQVERRRDRCFKWINKNGRGKQVTPTELPDYLNLGWSLGRARSHIY